MKRIHSLVMGPWVPPGLGKGPYLWIFSLGFFFWQFFYIRPSTLEVVASVLTVLLFVPVYFASHWVRNWQAAPFIALAFCLGTLWAPHNTGAYTFFIFAATMCARIESQRVAYAALGAILVLTLGVCLVVHMPPQFFLPMLIVGVPVGLASVMEAKVRRTSQQLLRKQEEVEHMATIAERERISRDLHDLLGHTLSLITLKAELAGKLLGRDEAACRKEIHDIETSARAALAEVRAAVSGYRATGFAHELACARATLSAANVSLRIDVAAVALPALAENVMALALREAVTNIVRHAGATECAVSVALKPGLIVLRIADNGAALGPGGAAGIARGNGLAGMQERVAALGGQLALRVERGLALELSLPMGAPA